MPKRQSTTRNKAPKSHSARPVLCALRAGADMDRIRRIRNSIRAGTYENDLKLTVAIDRLMTRVLTPASHPFAPAPTHVDPIQ